MEYNGDCSHTVRRFSFGETNFLSSVDVNRVLFSMTIGDLN